LIEESHPSRNKSDTYYINEEQLLRTHTSAHEVENISKHDAYCVFGDVYRRDEIDSTHYPVFHQMEVVRIYKKSDLIKIFDIGRND
jgi:phenylalanyl-tRNA synthetase alpha chain